MKKLITILLLLLSFGASAQFVNTTTVGSKSTLFKSLGGISADSAVIVLGSFTDTAAANYSVASKYNSIIRVGTSYWYRTLSPDKWNSSPLILVAYMWLLQIRQICYLTTQIIRPLIPCWR